VYRLFVALRYLRSKKLNLIAILGVAIGVMALLVVLSVMTGFDQELRLRIRGTLSDLIVEKWGTEGSDTFSGYEEDIRKLTALEHVRACAPHLEGLALIAIGKTYRWGQFIGIDLEAEVKATNFAGYYRAWRSGEAAEACRAALQCLAGAQLGARERAELVAEALHAAEHMSAAELEKLPKRSRQLLLALARDAGIDLAAAWRRQSQVMPRWEAGFELKASHAPVIVGRDLAVLGVDPDGHEVQREVGEQIVLLTLRGPFEQHDLKFCRIVGKFKSGMYEYDYRTLYMPLEQAQDLMRKPGHVSSINIRLDDYAHADAVRRAILGIPSSAELRVLHGILKVVLDRAGRPGLCLELEGRLEELEANYSQWLATNNPKLPFISRELCAAYFEVMDRLPALGLEGAVRGLEQARRLRRVLEERQARSLGDRYRVSTWEDKRRNILRAVAVERRVMAVILFFMVLLAGFIILAILYTTVVEKTRDIGILKSIGGTVGGIMSIFLLNGLLIGLFGAILGTIGGTLLCKYLNDVEDVIYKLTRWRVFPRDVYSLDAIPVDKDPFWSIVLIALTAILVSFLAAVYPAYKAARMHPVEALRYE